MARLDDILVAHVAQGADTADKLLGASFAVLDRDGNTIYQGASGRADFPLDAASYNDETPTMIMSLTKLITATAILQLVEKSLISLDQDLRELVPELARLQLLKGFDESDHPILENNTKPITLRQLLTHTSGLSYDLLMPDLIKWSASVGRTVNNLTWSVEGFSAPLIFPPGEAWMYGSSIDWAGLALEKVTGKTLGAYLDENIFKPLGMANTTFWPRKRDDLKDRLAVITFRPVSGNGNGEGLIAVPDPTPVEHEMESGGAGLYSTLGDYTRFVSALLRGDKILFQLESTRELLFAPQLDDVQRASMEQVVEAQRNIFAPDLPSGTPIDFGFGGMINTADVAGRRRKGSVMWSGMANAHWWIDQESGVAGVLFVTVLRDPPGDPVAIKLYRELEEAVYADLVKH